MFQEYHDGWQHRVVELAVDPTVEGRFVESTTEYFGMVIRYVLLSAWFVIQKHLIICKQLLK